MNPLLEVIIQNGLLFDAVGVIGLGLPTVAMGLLTLAMPPAEAAALLILPSLVTNLVQMRPFAEAARLAWRFRALLLGVTEELATLLLPPHYRTVVAFGVMALLLLLRPQGLFGAKWVRK